MNNKPKKNTKINKSDIFNKQGFLIVKNFLSKNKCNEIIKKLENIKNKRKINKNISVIELEITKKDWLKNAEILCSQYPELYEA